MCTLLTATALVWLGWSCSCDAILHAHTAPPLLSSLPVQVLKSKHHLVPRAIEVAATEGWQAKDRLQQYDELQPATLEAGAGAAAEPPAPLSSQLSRRLSQRLEEPRAVALLGKLRHAQAQMRVLDAAALLDALAAEVGADDPTQLAQLVGAWDDLAAQAAPAVPGSVSLPPGPFDPEALLAEVEAVEQALQQLEDDEGWLVSRSDSLRMLYRHVSGTTVHSLKFIATFDHPLEHLLALVHEFDLVKTWNK